MTTVKLYIDLNIQRFKDVSSSSPAADSKNPNVSSTGVATTERMGTLISTKRMFYGCSSLTTIKWSPYIPTEEITDMSYMFSGCSSLTELDLSNFDTRGVTDMSFMFEGCSKLTSLDLGNFDTSNVINMNSMFMTCRKLSSLDLRSFNTSNVTNMDNMFGSCRSLASLDLSNFDTSNVTNISYMFSWCSELASLDLSNFDTSNVTDMDRMFANNKNLKTIYCNKDWSSSEQTIDSDKMFGYCSSLKGAIEYDESKTDISYANPSAGYFTSPTITFDYTLSDDTSGTVSFSGEDNCSSLASWISENKSTLTTSVLSGLGYGSADSLFASCSSLTSLDLSDFDTSNITNMKKMFSGCSSLTELDLNSFDVSNVTNFYMMFNGCSKLEYIFCEDNWSLKHVPIDYNNILLFYNCNSLKGVIEHTYYTGQNIMFANPITGYFSRYPIIYFNNTKLGNVYFNNNELTEVYFNGKRVFYKR